MNKHVVTLSNGWTATFENNGEFRMGAEGWGLFLQGPDSKTIRYFTDQIILVNDDDGTRANACIHLSTDGNYGYFCTAVDSCWVIDFKCAMIAPHRVSIHHYHEVYDESIALYEQPAFKRVRQYISVIGKHIYLTFPFTKDEDFPKVWNEYVSIRRRQLDELYFRN